MQFPAPNRCPKGVELAGFFMVSCLFLGFQTFCLIIIYYYLPITLFLLSSWLFAKKKVYPVCRLCKKKKIQWGVVLRTLYMRPIAEGPVSRSTYQTIRPYTVVDRSTCQDHTAVEYSTAKSTWIHWFFFLATVSSLLMSTCNKTFWSQLVAAGFWFGCANYLMYGYTHWAPHC